MRSLPFHQVGWYSWSRCERECDAVSLLELCSRAWGVGLSGPLHRPKIRNRDRHPTVSPPLYGEGQTGVECPKKIGTPALSLQQTGALAVSVALKHPREWWISPGFPANESPLKSPLGREQGGTTAARMERKARPFIPHRRHARPFDHFGFQNVLPRLYGKPPTNPWRTVHLMKKAGPG